MIQRNSQADLPKFALCRSSPGSSICRAADDNLRRHFSLRARITWRVPVAGMSQLGVYFHHEITHWPIQTDLFIHFSERSLAGSFVLTSPSAGNSTFEISYAAA